MRIFRKGKASILAFTPRTTLACIGVVLAATPILSEAAAAQSLFESLFGQTRQEAPARAFVDSGDDGDNDGMRRSAVPKSRKNDISSVPSGHVVYCVRLCDGRYFPLQRAAGNPAQLCNALCPAAKTEIFSGSSIDRAVGPDGGRYADLDNSYSYRDALVAGCTCNGKDAIGLAPLDPKDDPTLKPGDIVATPDGLIAYRGGRNKTAAFTPVDKSVLDKTRRRLSQR